MKSIVLLSSGLDSAVNFLWARRETKILKAITFDYGQKSGQKEIYYASRLCKRYSVPHEIIRLEFLEKIDKSTLGKEGRPPILREEDLKKKEITLRSARAVWVPNRNGLFLNIAACFAEALGAELIVTGFNKEEAETFPDNSLQFVKIANEFFKYSTLVKPKVISYTQDMTKKEIVRKGMEFGLSFELIWSCYLGERKMCGKCESCLRLKSAVRGTAVYDIIKERMEHA